MMSYISNSADFYKMKRDADKADKEMSECFAAFFKENKRPLDKDKDKEKAREILNCRFGNFSR